VGARAESLRSASRGNDAPHLANPADNGLVARDRGGLARRVADDDRGYGHTSFRQAEEPLALGGVQVELDIADPAAAETQAPAREHQVLGGKGAILCCPGRGLDGRDEDQCRGVVHRWFAGSAILARRSSLPRPAGSVASWYALASVERRSSSSGSRTTVKRHG